MAELWPRAELRCKPLPRDCHQISPQSSDPCYNDSTSWPVCGAVPRRCFARFVVCHFHLLLHLFASSWAHLSCLVLSGRPLRTCFCAPGTTNMICAWLSCQCHGMGIFDERDPLSLHMLGMHGPEPQLDLCRLMPGMHSFFLKKCLHCSGLHMPTSPFRMRIASLP